MVNLYLYQQYTVCTDYDWLAIHRGSREALGIGGHYRRRMAQFGFHKEEYTCIRMHYLCIVTPYKHAIGKREEDRIRYEVLAHAVVCCSQPR